MYTSHGHQIPGTISGEGERPPVKRCGGIRLCAVCKKEAVRLVVVNPTDENEMRIKLMDRLNDDIHTNFQLKARTIVFNYIKPRLEKTDKHVTFAENEVYVVWFSKTLQNWKALVSTTLPDGMYYEVTYNGERCETYLDVYKKFDNVCVTDEELDGETNVNRGFSKHNVTIHGSPTGVQVGHGNMQTNVLR